MMMMITAMIENQCNDRKDASLTGVNQGRERKVAVAGGQSSISFCLHSYIGEVY